VHFADELVWCIGDNAVTWVGPAGMYEHLSTWFRILVIATVGLVLSVPIDSQSTIRL
jgi:hypothetical protein